MPMPWNKTASAAKKTHKYTVQGRRLIAFLNLVRKIYFCAINRQWGYNHTNLTGLAKVNGEHSLIMLVYNIKRKINILGIPDLIAKLKKWNSPHKAKILFLLKTGYLKLHTIDNFYPTKLAASKKNLL